MSEDKFTRMLFLVALASAAWVLFLLAAMFTAAAVQEVVWWCQ